jgi:hypothetical protein
MSTLYLAMTNDDCVKSPFWLFIPAEAGIKYFQDLPRILDTRFRGYDDFLRVRQ